MLLLLIFAPYIFKKYQNVDKKEFNKKDRQLSNEQKTSLAAIENCSSI